MIRAHMCCLIIPGTPIDWLDTLIDPSVAKLGMSGNPQICLGLGDGQALLDHLLILGGHERDAAGTLGA